MLRDIEKIIKIRKKHGSIAHTFYVSKEIKKHIEAVSMHTGFPQGTIIDLAIFQLLNLMVGADSKPIVKPVSKRVNVMTEATEDDDPISF